MQHRSVDGRHIVRIEAGERVMPSLTRFFGELNRREGVTFANISGAGAVSRARLAYWDADSKEYIDRDFVEQLEVVSFLGNLAMKEGQPFAHLHVVLSRADFSTVGGHLQDAVVRPTLEVWLRAEEVVVERRLDPASGLYLLNLAES
jgi:predicted DNA-binding protein with PD1-like motif